MTGNRHPSARARRLACATFALATVAALSGCHDGPSEPEGWEPLEPGLELGRFRLCDRSDGARPQLAVVRADPDRFEWRAATVSRVGDGRLRTAREWARDEGLVVATNAGMFHPDLIRHVGLMIDDGHANNPVPAAGFNSVLAFEPHDTADPPWILRDLGADRTLEDVRSRYASVVQNLRMISDAGENMWNPSEERWPVSALGVDTAGRILFLFSRERRSVHHLNRCLLDLPLDIRHAQYLEGGPEASLYVGSDTRRFELTGSSDLAPLGAPGADPLALPIPNAIGLARAGG